jgi:hypothetical protein
MPDNYEDNFGFYNAGDDPDELALFGYIKLTSELKVCVRCYQKVYLQPEKEICEFRRNPAGDSDLMSAAVPI